MSHETIYQSLFVQSRGALRKDLTGHLRTGRTMRKPRAQAARPGPPAGRRCGTSSRSANAHAEAEIAPSLVTGKAT